MENINENVEVSTNLDNGMKKTFNTISNSLFMGVLFLAALAIVIPFYRIEISIAGLQISERFFLFNYFSSDEAHRFRGFIYLVVVGAVIGNVAIGAKHGIKSFKDGNEKIQMNVIFALSFLVIPFLFTRLLQSRTYLDIIPGVSGHIDTLNISFFIPFVLLIGLLSIITKKVFNFILIRDQLNSNELKSLIFSNVSILLLVITMVIFFNAAAFEVRLLGPISLNSSMGGMALLRELEGLNLGGMDNLINSLSILTLLFFAISMGFTEGFIRIFRKSILISKDDISKVNRSVILGASLIIALFGASIVFTRTDSEMVSISLRWPMFTGLIFAILTLASAIASNTINSKNK